MLDEPSSGLAPLIMAGVFRLTESLKAQGSTILQVAQNARNALSVANTAYVLDAAGSRGPARPPLSATTRPSWQPIFAIVHCRPASSEQPAATWRVSSHPCCVLLPALPHSATPPCSDWWGRRGGAIPARRGTAGCRAQCHVPPRLGRQAATDGLRHSSGSPLRGWRWGCPVRWRGSSGGC